jgi:hypothetical protein
MRWRLAAGLVVLAVAALAVGAPTLIIQRQMVTVLREHVEPDGTVRVRVLATAWGLVQQQVTRMRVEATGIRLGDLVADRLNAQLAGIEFERSPQGWVPVRVRAGTATAEIGQARLEQFLRERGVEQPEVRVEPAGIIVLGAMPAGAVRVTVRLQGQFEAAGRDLRFRATSLEIGGTEVPQQLADTLVGLVQPSISLSRLPIPLVVQRVSAASGRLIVRAQAEEAR